MRVLIVDDAEDIRMLMRITLQRDGRFEVVGEAADGAVAIELTQQLLPDAVVLDLSMPVMDGLQALPEIRLLVPNATIVILSGFQATQMADEAMSLGADAYLEKGAAFSRLVTLLLESRDSDKSERQASPAVAETAALPSLNGDVRRIADDVGDCSDFPTAFEKFAQAASGVVRFDRASFWVATSESDEFECAAIYDHCQKRLPVGRHMVITGRARRVLEGRPLIEPDTASDPYSETNGVLQAHGIQSYVSIPLVIGGTAKALVNFSSERPQTFTHDDAPLLETLVRESGSTLHLLFLLDKERQSGTELREERDMKNDLVGMVAHDLRSPMTVIGGYAQYMKDSWSELEEDQKLEFLEAITRNIDDVAELVEDMLEVSSLESGQLKCDIKPFDLAKLIRDTVAELTMANQDRPYEASVPDEVPTALGDVRRQRQILGNLTSNAVKFSPPPKPIEVLVGVDGEFAYVSVRDEGDGIDADSLPKIFEKFYRVKGKSGRKTAGIGLGLYICKLLVEAQGGKIWADSEPGKGSTFTYTVPVDEKLAPEAVAA